jgi:hypothetical protein
MIYRRPRQTALVFDCIRNYAPERLYIANDGPRENENEICKKTLAVIQNIDWPCEVFQLERNTNIGCALAVSQAISWFFDKEESGVILEDDTLPHPDFFRFCEILLPQFQYTNEVLMISGNNKIGYATNGCSYSQIPLANIWGWATWRRAWANFDFQMSDWPTLKIQPYLKEATAEQYNHKLRQYQDTFDGKIDSWGYRWEIAMLAQKAKCLIPARNLIQNIGFGPDAYHTKTIPPGIYNTLNCGLDFPLIHLL